MIPPRVKVAIVTEERMIRLRTSAPFNLITDSEQPLIYTPGELTLSAEGSRESINKHWLWCGSFFQLRRAEEIERMFIKQGLRTRLLPVGFSPQTTPWSPRRYRLLIDAESEGESVESISERVQRLLPDIKPILCVLQAKPESTTISIVHNGISKSALQKSIIITSEKPVQMVDIPVGRGFHWEHKETQTLPSPVWISADADGSLCAGVEITLEEYLASVNSSEMPAESPVEFLKAQVVAARSWLLANWGSHHPDQPFTVCAGDHCQCYYGLDRVQERSKLTVESTKGQVLMFQDRICDARYAKSCGGVTEPGANVWPFLEEPYLGHLTDLPKTSSRDLSDEDDFRDFQERNNSNDACCAPGYAPLRGRLSELSKQYRWTIESDEIELEKIIHEKTGRDLGNIIDIIPIKRGPSGRLISVEVRGRKNFWILTPELEIRRCLSRTHLPSSAFWIEKRNNGEFVFHGSGWGHGAGMCQIGAAALAQRGFDYRAILMHYFQNTSIEKIY